VNRSSSTKTLQAAVQPQPEPVQPHIIHPTAVYFVDQAQKILRLKESTIRREVRAGRLQIAKRAGRYYLLGAWIISWLQAGAIQRRRPLASSTNINEHNGEI